MKTLIEDLESAPTGSRELDAEVAYVFGWRHSLHDEGDWGGRSPGELIHFAGVWRPPEAPVRTFENDGDPRYVGDPPEYTQSLDDALGLVGEGWQIYRAEVLEDGDWTWELDKHRYTASRVKVRGAAAKPAPALCIALLKAKTIDTAESVSVT